MANPKCPTARQYLKIGFCHLKNIYLKIGFLLATDYPVRRLLPWDVPILNGASRMNRTILMAALLAGTAMATALPARADVNLEFKAGGTGDNVVFNSLAGALALATLNGQHNEFVQFRDLTSSATFTAAANGNDIKISGTNNLFIQVFDPTDTFVVGTTTQIFSLKGTGNVTAFVGASLNGVDEGFTSFSLGAIDPNAQSFYTFSAVNGEIMTSLRLLETTVGGSIEEFEHYRIDVAAVAAVPGPVVGAGIPGLVAACGGMFGLNFWRRRRHGGTLPA